MIYTIGMRQRCVVERLGVVVYEEAWHLQEIFAAEIARGERPPTLLLLEHPPTYTFGRRGRIENLLWDEAELERRGVAIHWVDRGGDVTYHGPGQLVCYPLLPLSPGGLQPDPESGNPRLPQADYIGYIRKLETVLILALMKLGLASGQVSGLTGVWVQPDVLSRCIHCPPEMRQRPAKVAAIGVKVDAKGVSRHGFALNVNPDMTYWDGIVGCGLKDHPITCLADLLDLLPTMAHVMDEVTVAFGEVFGYEIIQKPSNA